jgi:NADPH:quinone reductase-like Zn-dependent oxidoreductase
MRAVVRDEYGSAEVLSVEDVPIPDVPDDEVLVKVGAAGLDRGTWHLMTGLPYPMRLAGFGVRRPKERGLGMDVAGEIVAAGPGVEACAPGDLVFGVGRASFAEYTLASPRKLAPMPTNATFAEAAAVPVSGLAALHAVRDHGRVTPGDTVLVVGASGGVGTFAVQIAVAAGARVTGVCSGEKAELVRSLGADVIDYRTTEITDDGRRFDVVIDIGGNRPLSLLRRALAPRGCLVIVGGEAGGRWTGGLGRQLRAVLLSPFVRQKLGTFVSRESSEDLDQLAELVEVGTVTPVVDSVVALDEVPDAMRAMEAGRIRGKIVVTP